MSETGSSAEASRAPVVTGSCHCGAVSFALTEVPEKLVDCNCSICRRLGALWGHVPIEAVEVSGGATIAYTRDDRNLAFHTCVICGCTTHWENLRPDQSSHMAVNFRLVDPAVAADLRTRKFDGADTWEYLD